MKKIVNKIQEAIRNASIPLDPPYFSEYPIASQTSWTPLKPGGSNFKTHTFKLIDTHRAVFGATIGARLFAMVFGSVGFVVGIVGVIILLASTAHMILVGLGLAVFGGIFAGIGIFLYRTYDKAIVFDLSDGLFWRGKRPNLSDSAQKPETWCRITKIVGIQVLRERVTGDKSSYYSYELNLVLEDASRRHVVDHGSLKQISLDAQQLGEFLQVPVWNGS